VWLKSLKRVTNQSSFVGHIRFPSNYISLTLYCTHIIHSGYEVDGCAYYSCCLYFFLWKQNKFAAWVHYKSRNSIIVCNFCILIYLVTFKCSNLLCKSYLKYMCTTKGTANVSRWKDIWGMKICPLGCNYN
jgi:hypothetical protein